MDKHKSLQEIQVKLLKLWQFLQNYLPLANAHNTSFIVQDYWEKYLPLNIRRELLDLDLKDLNKLPSGVPDLRDCDEQKMGAKQFLEAVNTETKHVEATDMKNAALYEQNTSQLTKENLSHTSGGTESMLKPKLNSSQLPTWTCDNLHDFVKEAHTYNLENLVENLDIQTIFQNDTSALQKKQAFVKNFMDIKKAHEVEEMAGVCARLAHSHGIHHVLDIGSGRGYLGAQLALMYQLQVLGLDSSSTNTNSAKSRSQKLAKHWPGLVRNLQQGTTKKKGKKKKKHTRGGDDFTASQSNTRRNPNNASNSFTKSVLAHTEYNHQEKDTENVCDKTAALGHIVNKFDCKLGDSKVKPGLFCDTDAQAFNFSGDILPSLFGANDSKTTPNSPIQHDTNPEKYVNVHVDVNSVSNACSSSTCITKEESDSPVSALAEKTPAEHNTEFHHNKNKPDSQEQEHAAMTPTSAEGKQEGLKADIQYRRQQNSRRNIEGFISSTMFVTEKTDLQGLVNTQFPDCTQCLKEASKGFMITGLHTCGNLASNILKIFVASPGARAVCNVGCCYHLVEEDFIRNPFLKSDDAPPEETGFPMSEFLHQQRCYLGRNARMLSLQAIYRLTEENQIPSNHQVIFHRALLQVVLCDLLGGEEKDWVVGRQKQTCATFVEYAKYSLRKLGLEDDKITDERLADYEAKYSHMATKMFAYVQLRTVLAPCIEALILLDRLCYLLEQDDVQTAHLVRLFDPVTSPRCYALIAHKGQAHAR